MSTKAKSRRLGLPYLFINMAMSADGKIATANRAVHSFGSARDLRHLYELRATADAVMCGARTVEISEATLGNGGEKFRRLRLKNKRAEFPLRVIVSGSGSIEPSAKIFQKRFSPIIVLTTKRAPKKALLQLREQADEIKISDGPEIDFHAALRWLYEKWRVKRLLCEGGGELNDALFRAGLVDEVHVTICPKIFGGRAAPTIADGKGFQRLAKAARFKTSPKTLLNGELFTVLLRQKTG
jgi:riboflavin-specific deaminase-like protein